VQRDFEHPLRVRYGECDPQGIVFNANYLLYFDVVFTVDVVRDSELLVAGRLVHVCVSSTDWRKTELPDWVRAGLLPYANADADADAEPATGASS
jgi:acyl-CoA thioesterase FadM